MIGRRALVDRVVAPALVGAVFGGVVGGLIVYERGSSSADAPWSRSSIGPVDEAVPTTAVPPPMTTTTATSSRPAGPATTAIVPTASTSTTAPFVAACTASEVELSTVVQDSAVEPGMSPDVLATVRNTSSRPCRRPAVTNMCIYNSERSGCTATSREHGDVLAPGRKWGMRFPVPQRWCWTHDAEATRCEPIPPGEYVLQIYWGRSGDTSVTFTVDDD